MVTIDIPACMALGAATAVLRPQDSVWEARFRTLGVTLFGFTPLAHLFELYFHDWEWQYLAPALPPWTSMAFIIVMNALGLLTFEACRRLIVAGKKREAWAVFLGVLGLPGLYALVFFRRVFWVGTYAEWASGTAPFMLSRVDFMLLLVGTGSYLGASIYMWLLRGRAVANAPRFH